MAKKITKDMLKIYKPISGLDWMNYKLVKKDATFHHIQKKCDGGKEEISNGAILMPISHEYLHLIENKDMFTYCLLNRMFRIINMQRSEPNEEQRKIIECLLKMFEEEHKEDKNARNKALIKYQYIERG